MQPCYMIREVRAIADVCRLGSHYVITRINVSEEYRGRGYGSKLLKEICNDADNEGATLMLECVSSGEMDDMDLAQWYIRNGFTPQHENVFVRHPNRYNHHALYGKESNNENKIQS